MLKHELSQEYARWNKNVFKSFLKENNDCAERTFMARMFQTRASDWESSVAKQ